MTKSALLLAAAGLLMAADAPKTFTGVIGDDMCEGDHKSMGGTDPAKCTDECIKSMHGKYALWVDEGAKKETYVLADQKLPAPYAGKKVTVTGIVGVSGKEKTLTVQSLTPVK